MFHSNDVVSGVDMVDLTGDPAREIGQQINRGISNFLDRYAAPKRRIVLVPFEDVAEVADAGGGERLDWSSRYRVDPNVSGAEIGRQITHGCFQAGLGDAHDVVVRHPLFG